MPPQFVCVSPIAVAIALLPWPVPVALITDLPERNGHRGLVTLASLRGERRAEGWPGPHWRRIRARSQATAIIG
jgi:hypothetical protein